MAAQGVGKLADPTGYVAALSGFHLLPAFTLWPIAIAWILVELFAATLLSIGTVLRRRTPRFAGAAGALLAGLGYALLTFLAYFRGFEVANCTCFGVFLPQRLSVWILFQDLSMLYWAGSELRSAWNDLH